MKKKKTVKSVQRKKLWIKKLKMKNGLNPAVTYLDGIWSSDNCCMHAVQPFYTARVLTSITIFLPFKNKNLMLYWLGLCQVLKPTVQTTSNGFHLKADNYKHIANCIEPLPTSMYISRLTKLMITQQKTSTTHLFSLSLQPTATFP